MALRKKVVLVGSVLLIVGVFIPIVQLSIVGSVDCLRNGRGDGNIVLVLGAVSLLVALWDGYGWLWLTGVGSLATEGFTLVRISRTLAETQSNLS